jgi:hypothetical protein
MNVSKFLFFFVLFLAVDFSVFGQADFRRGYFIDNSWDTVPGWIDYRGSSKNMEVCVFRSDAENSPVSYTAKQIRGYRFTDEERFFVSRFIKTESICDTVFLEYLVDGISDLFFYQNSQLYSAYFIESPNGELLEVRKLPDTKETKDGVQYYKKDYSYYGSLSYALGGCAQLRGDLQTTEINHKSLIKVVQKYHEYKCSDEVCIVYEKSIEPITVSLCPIVGYAASSVKFIETERFDKYDFDLSHSFMWGINGDIWLPQMNERLRLVVGITYNQDYFHGSYFEPIGINPAEDVFYSDCHLRRGNIRGSFSVKYTTPRSKYRTFVLGGIFGKAVLSEDCNIVQEVKYQSVVTTDQIQSETPRRTIMGLIGGVGVQTQLFDNTDAFVQFSYSYGKTMLGGYGNIERNNTVALVAGIFF